MSTSHFFPQNFNHRSTSFRTKNSFPSRTIIANSQMNSLEKNQNSYQYPKLKYRSSIDAKQGAGIRNFKQRMSLMFNTTIMHERKKQVAFRSRKNSKNLFIKGFQKQQSPTKQMRIHEKAKTRAIGTASIPKRKSPSYLSKRVPTDEQLGERGKLWRGGGSNIQGWVIADEEFVDFFN